MGHTLGRLMVNKENLTFIYNAWLSGVAFCSKAALLSYHYSLHSQGWGVPHSASKCHCRTSHRYALCPHTKDWVVPHSVYCSFSKLCSMLHIQTLSLLFGLVAKLSPSLPFLPSSVQVPARLDWGSIIITVQHQHPPTPGIVPKQLLMGWYIVWFGMLKRCTA